MIDLGTLGGAWSIATAISDRGQVVGYSDDASGTHHAFVWQNGTMTRLPSPTGGGPAGAVAINDENQIVGDDCYECWDDSGQNGPLTGSRFAVLWTLTPQGIVTRKILGSR